MREERPRDLGGGFQTIVFGTDPLGKTMLMTEGPMSYSKAAWYEQSMFNFIMLITTIMFIAGILFYWVINAAIQRIRHRKGGLLMIPKGAKI